MNYLRNMYQRTKVGGEFSTWKELPTGVPQGFVLLPLLFNIYLNDLFHFINNANFCNFADDTTLHSSRFNVNDVMTDIENGCSTLVEWFRYNYLILIMLTNVT